MADPSVMVREIQAEIASISEELNVVMANMKAIEHVVKTMLRLYQNDQDVAAHDQSHAFWREFNRCWKRNTKPPVYLQEERPLKRSRSLP